MNNALYEIASFMVFRESVIWRWSHTDCKQTVVTGWMGSALNHFQQALEKTFTQGSGAQKNTRFRSKFHVLPPLLMHGLSCDLHGL